MFNNFNPYNNFQPYRQQTQQLYQQTAVQQPMQTMQTNFMSPQNNVQFATLDEAKAWILTPNSQVIFLDKDRQKCYLKTADQNGQSNLVIYNLQQENSDNTSTIQPTNLNDFVKKDELKNFITNDDFSKFAVTIKEQINALSNSTKNYINVEERNEQSN